MTLNKTRVDELMKAMKAFGKERYEKSEMLDEMLALQSEMVHLTFNDEHASTAELKLTDVINHLEQLNSNCGNVADEEMTRFREGAEELVNLIKVEKSGAKGEARAFNTLKYVQSKNIVLKNIELTDGDFRTELDAVVVLPKAIAILEVKNSSKDILIDDEGNYFRISETKTWDCNIAEKFATKETLLKHALKEGGIVNIPIRRIVVFTNNKIQIQNDYPYIKKCYANQLPRVLDGLRGDKEISDNEMEKIAKAIQNAGCKEAYPCELNTDQFKQDFATLMAILEEASVKVLSPKVDNEGLTETVERSDREQMTRPTPNHAGYAIAAIASAVMTLLISTAVQAIKNHR